MYAIRSYYAFEQAKAVLEQYAEFVKTIPEDLNIWVVLRKAPPSYNFV